MNYIELYSDFLKKYIHLEKPIRLIADCSNGTTGLVLNAFKDIPNLELSLLNANPDPEFAAHGPNPLAPGAANAVVAEIKAHPGSLGVLFDADGDRAFFIDEEGVLLPSFIIAILLFRHNQPPFVADETVYELLQHLKLFKPEDLYPSRIGSYFVKQELRKVGASVAAEYSGHYYFKDFFNADSGIFTMIQVLNTLSQMSVSLADFVRSLPPHALASDDMKIGLGAWPELQKKIEESFATAGARIEHRDGITLDFGEAWINIRPSNTEPLLRFIAGAPTQEAAQILVQKVKGSL
jgi:phosphomannomutase